MHILDGGLSNALEARGHDLTQEGWTASVLREQPAEILEVHRGYFQAGADVATTASYQETDPGLLRLSVELAKEAAGEASDRLVAASVGPYGAILGDGSEYRGHYGLTAQELELFHRPRIEALVAAGPDLLAIETIPDTDEAAVLAKLLTEFDYPAWFSYSTDGGRTCAGQELAEAFAIAAAVDSVVAVGVNCCPPTEVLAAMKIAAKTGKAGVTYPNAGEIWDAENSQWFGSTSYDPELVPDWIGSGARWIGGCCRVGTEAITQIAERAGACDA